MPKVYVPTGTVVEFSYKEILVFKDLLGILENAEVQLAQNDDKCYDSDDVHYPNFKVTDKTAGACLSGILNDLRELLDE